MHIRAIALAREELHIPGSAAERRRALYPEHNVRSSAKNKRPRQLVLKTSGINEGAGLALKLEISRQSTGHVAGSFFI